MSQINPGILNNVKPGDEIIVRFAKGGSRALIHVFAMGQTGVLNIEAEKLLFLKTVYFTANWGARDKKRWQTFVAGPKWDQNFFVKHIGEPAIESLGVIPRQA